MTDYRALAMDGTIFLEPNHLDEAILGFAEDGRLVYSYEKLIACFAEDLGDEDDASEWIHYNTLRALPYMGEQAPWVATALPVGEVDEDDATALSVVVGDQTYWRLT